MFRQALSLKFLLNYSLEFHFNKSNERKKTFTKTKSDKVLLIQIIDLIYKVPEKILDLPSLISHK